MSYKVVKNSLGVVVAYGPNCSEYEPNVALGNTIDILDEIPVAPIENPRIAEIKAELDALDFKKIRPIASGDTEYLAKLQEQTVALQDELKAIQD